jgi:hypothetical protein
MKLPFHPCFRASLAGLILTLISASAILAQVSTPPATSRAWVTAQGRVLKGALVSTSGVNAVLRLENGAQVAVPLATLSPSDQAFIRQQKSPAAPDGPRPSAPLTWPSIVIIDPKALNIVTGLQDAKQRQFHYESGSFEFIASAPLTGSVMKDVAIDFELVQAFFNQAPWGWQPKPKAGTHFRVFLTETLNDFIALGGNDTSGGGSKDDYIFTKFSGLGLEKIGQRYAFNARKKNEGDVIGLTFRLMMGDMNFLTYPWAEHGMEELTRKVAYHKGTLRFADLEKPLKERIDEDARIGVKLDADRLVAAVHMTWQEQRRDVSILRRQYYLDGLMLVYFFGFLDGDGKGTRLHQYFRSMAQDSLAWRAWRESGGKTTRPRDTGTYADWSLELLNTVIAGRTDAQLRAEMIAKFRTISVKLE